MKASTDTVVFSKARLDQVLKAVELLAAGDLTTRVPISPTRDEIDAFALAVNILASELAYTTVSKEHVTNILSAISDLVLVVDASGRVTDANRAAEVVLGESLKALVNRSLSELVTSSARAHELLATLNTERSIKDFEVEFRGKNGRAVPMSVNGGAQFDAGRGQALLVLVGRDLTVLRELIAEATLVDVERRKSGEFLKAKEAAEEASRLKTSFLANVSHEIRTPMTAILGFAELLQNPESTPESRARHAERLSRNGRLLLRLIDDILDLSQIESGRLEILPATVTVAELAQAVIGAVEPMALAKGVNLTASRHDDLPAKVVLDPLRARQALLNVVANAVKFTKAGQVTMALTYEGEPGHGALVADVEDTGIGISKEKQPLLFQAFFQSDPSVRAQFGGSGLGLVLARELARAMGGDLVLVRSEPGVGSHFRVTLPDHLPVGDNGALASFEPEMRAPPLAGVLSGRHVLLCEDAPDTQELLRIFLTSVGASVHIVGNGRDAVDAALAGSFDLILLDLRMPIMGGFEAVQILRSSSYAGRIVAVTAHAMRDEIDRCLVSGFDDVLTKPISRAVLVERILTLLED